MNKPTDQTGLFYAFILESKIFKEAAADFKSWFKIEGLKIEFCKGGFEADSREFRYISNYTKSNDYSGDIAAAEADNFADAYKYFESRKENFNENFRDCCKQIAESVLEDYYPHP